MYKQIYVDNFGDITDDMKNYTEEDFKTIVEELLSCLNK